MKLKVKYKKGKNFFKVKALLKVSNLKTICEESDCPNVYECWEELSPSFLILGNYCTQKCSFCNLKFSKEGEIDPEEPLRLARAVRYLNLKYVVITSVRRRDLEDEGANHFKRCVELIRELSPSTKVEILIPVMERENLKVILSSKPDVLSHNLETVRRLSKRIGRDYEKSLEVLSFFKGKLITKSNLMLGLGEEEEEIYQTLKDLKEVGVSILTVGQYLKPKNSPYPVKKYYKEEEFKRIERWAKELGFKVFCSPRVRTSYHEVIKLFPSQSPPW